MRDLFRLPIVVLVLLAAMGGTGSAKEATLDSTALSATGRDATGVTIPEVGRWSIRADSERGTALRLVDRRTGPGPWSGAAGGEDGRLDVFLDGGEYRIESRGPELEGDDGGGVALSVEPFVPRALDPVRGTLDTAMPATLAGLSLGDLEAVAVPLVVRGGHERVAIEAAGRHLGELRIWRLEGDDAEAWMVDAAPTMSVIEPIVGRPLRLARISTRLDAGVYRLVAYGGPSLDWADGATGDERPLHLRVGVPSAAMAARVRRSISPFGVDRVVVPPEVDFVRLEVPPTGPPLDASVALTASPYVPELPFDEPVGEGRAVTRAAVTKDLVPPVVELSLPPSNGTPRVVTVRGEPGREVVLQHFPRAGSSVRVDSGTRWLSVLPAGAPADVVDTTAVLVARDGGRLRFVDSRAIPLRRGTRVERAIDLPSRTKLLLEVEESLELRVGTGPESSTAVDVSITPFDRVLAPPRGFERPPLRPVVVGAAESWSLERGTYLLVVAPRRAGDVTLRLDAAGGASVDLPRQGAARFGVVSRTKPSELRLPDRPSPVTVVQRPSPVDLGSGLGFEDGAGALALVQSAGEETGGVPVRVQGAGRITATAEDGSVVDLASGDLARGEPTGDQGGASWTSALEIPAGGWTGTVRLRPLAPPGTGGAAAPRWVELAFTPSLPAPPARGETPPPVLRVGAPASLTLGRQASERFALRVDEPALHVVESSGLLDTVGRVASATEPALELDDDGGDGRNFLLQSYLRPGTYRLGVATIGRSAGALGVRLSKAPIDSGGPLRLGVPARRAIEPVAAVAYDLEIPESVSENVSENHSAEAFRLRVLSLGEPFRVRLEDADGWPLLPPGPLVDETLELTPGRFRVIVLPQQRAARALMRVDPVRDDPVRDDPPASPAERADRGPRPLPLDAAVEHVWLEERSAAERPVDLWDVELPAPADVEISIVDATTGRAGAFEAELVAIDSSGDETSGDPVEVTARGWSGRVEAGAYRLRVRSVRPDSRRRYAVRVAPRQLLPGMVRTIDFPGNPLGDASGDAAEARTIPLSVAEAGLYELTTFGAVDLRARLVGPDGVELARADDRPGDWNPRLARRLAPGALRLELERVGGGDAGRGIAEPVEVAFTRLREVDVEALAVDRRHGGRTTVTLPDAVVRMPLALPDGADLVVVEARGPSIEATLERETADGWAPIASGSSTGDGNGVRLATSRPADDSRLRLRLAAPDRGGGEVEVAIAAPRLEPRVLADGGTAERVRLERLPGLGRAGAARVTLPAVGGCIEVEGDGRAPVDGTWIADSWITSRPGRPLAPTPRRLAPTEDALWIVADPDRPPRLRISRLEPGSTARVGVPATGGSCAVAPGDAVAVVVDGVDAAADVTADATADATADVMERARGSSRAVEADGRRALVVLPASDAARPIRFDGDAREVTARVTGDGETTLLEAPFGALDAAVPPGGRLRLALPAGAKRLRVALDRGLAALAHAPSADGAATLWADREPVESTVETDAAELLVIDASEPAAGGRVRLLVESVSRAELRLVDDAPFARRTVRSGRLVLSVEPNRGSSSETPSETLGASSGTLRVRGARSAVFLADSGGSVRDADPPIDLELESTAVGGRLVVEHDPGVVLAWIDRPGEPAGPWVGRGASIEEPTALDPAGDSTIDPSSIVRPPATVALAGSSARVAIELDEASIVHVRAATPSISALVRARDAVGDASPRAAPGVSPEISPEISVHLDRTSLDRPLPAGRSVLELRGIEGPLVGTLSIVAERPASLGEGLGPEVLLEPGASRWFRVDVPRRGPIGFGVRAAADVASARLLDADGATLGEGVVLLRELEPGTYYLALELPAAAAPVAARPAIAGLERPETGPPREVLERYLGEAEPSEAEADERAERDRVGRSVFQLVEGVGIVVGVEVDADAREDVDLPADAGGEERVGDGVRQTVRHDDAHAGGGVEVAADADVADRGDGEVVGAAEAVLVDLGLELDVEEAARLVLVVDDDRVAVVVDAVEAIVGDVVEGLPEARAEAEAVLGGLGRWRADERDGEPDDERETGAANGGVSKGEEHA